MFAALAIITVAAITAVGAGHTPPGRRILARWTSIERVGEHRLGISRKQAERLNRRIKIVQAFEKAWTELAPATRVIQSTPTW